MPGPEDLLERYRRLVADGVERRLPTGDPAPWLYEPLAEYPRRPGKGIRGALCLAACEAAGAPAERALPAAVAIELLHDACLVHDDIEDGAGLRRGGPALHHLAGLPLALNAGDALALLAHDTLAAAGRALGPRLTAALAAELSAALWRTLEGQATELGWRRDGVVDVGVEDYLGLVLRKTCWYTAIAPLRAGALIGARGRAPGPALSRLGFGLGVAFQVTDDVLNVVGADGYDKDAAADLREGKRTLLLVHLLSVASAEDAATVRGWLAPGRDLDAEQAAALAGLLHRYGSVEAARRFARGAAESAAALLPAAFPAPARSEPVALLRHLLEYVVERDN